MKTNKRKDSISTFIGPDVSIEGVIEFEGTIRLDGHIKGKIYTSSGTVIVGEKAVLDADVIVDVAIIMGEVNGTVDARERIEVYPPGRVLGNIQAPVISIESGVVFNGSCLMTARTISATKVTDTTVKTAIEMSKGS